MKRHVVSFMGIFSILAILSCTGRHVEQKPETTPPTVVSTSPANGATAVAINTAVTVTFSEAMNASTIDGASFLLKSVTSTLTTTVTGTVTYDPISYVATFTSGSVLEHNTTYTAAITANAKDLAGNALVPISWAFTTVPAPGALDAAFGSNGRVRSSIASASDDAAFAAAIQQDEKIVTAGYTSKSTPLEPAIITLDTGTIPGEINYTGLYFTLQRFQPNGALDTTFGLQQNGRADYFFGKARSVGLQPDGKIVAAGDSGALLVSAYTAAGLWLSTRPVYTSDFQIVRYNADGTLDTTFGPQSKGTVTCDMGFDYDMVNSLAIQTDGNIVVAGTGINSGSRQSFIVARFTKEGSLDATFNLSGKIVSTASITASAAVVKIQSDGNIVVGGTITDASGLQSIYVTRYASDGSPDASFNSGMVTRSTGTNSILRDLEILPGGKILVAGTTNNSTYDIFLMQFNADGTVDSAFGSNGMVITDDLNQGVESASGLAVQSDGKIVVSATFHPSVGPILTDDFALFRYLANGTLDTSFGNGHGMVTTDLGSGLDDEASGVLIQQDGKIVVVGYSSNGPNYDIGLARYWP